MADIDAAIAAIVARDRKAAEDGELCRTVMFRVLLARARFFRKFGFRFVRETRRG